MAERLKVVLRRLLVGLVMFCMAATSAAIPGDSQTLEDNAWKLACVFGHYDCKNIQPPKVVYKHLGIWALGAYTGGDEVYLTTNLNYVDALGTLTHEMVHYLQVKVGKLEGPYTRGLICWMEKDAHEIERLAMGRVGYLSNSPEWDERRAQAYGCTNY